MHNGLGFKQQIERDRENKTNASHCEGVNNNNSQKGLRVFPERVDDLTFKGFVLRASSDCLSLCRQTQESRIIFKTPCTLRKEDHLISGCERASLAWDTSERSIAKGRLWAPPEAELILHLSF